MADALLEDLKLHVETPTGGGNLEAIEESRTLLTKRLDALGAKTTLTVKASQSRPGLVILTKGPSHRYPAASATGCPRS